MTMLGAADQSSHGCLNNSPTSTMQGHKSTTDTTTNYCSILLSTDTIFLPLLMTHVIRLWLVMCCEDLLWSPHLPVSSPAQWRPATTAAFLRGVAWKNNQGMFKCRSYLLGTITINILQRADTRRLGTQKHRSILQTSKSKFGWRKNTIADHWLFV